MLHTTAKYLLFSFLPLFLFPVNVQAQITPDGTTSTTVNPTANGVQIDNGNQSGGNLFHSFEQFSVPTDTEAYFNNATNIVNIFSRVTGISQSNIDGLIRANGTANLFLINPNGIIFGENASLNIGGSFFATTAHSILFPDGEFIASSTEQSQPLLSENIPIGANFRDNPGTITNQSSGLQVNPGQSLTLLGGNVNFDGGVITAAGGKVELGGLTTAGTVDIVDGSLSFRDGITRGDITLDNASAINVRSTGSGSININGNNITIQNSSQLRGGISENLLNPEAQAGNITLNATSDITLTNDEITVGNLNIITNSTFGQGNAGNVTLTANNGTITIDNSIIFSTVESSAIGNAGDVTIEARSLSLLRGGQIQSLVRQGNQENPNAGQGNAGNIEISVDEGVNITGENAANFASAIFSQVEAGNFNAGDITINIRDGSFVMERQEGQVGDSRNRLNSSTAGTGQAGTIVVNASNTITISDSDIITDGNDGRIYLGTTNLFDLAQSNNNETNSVETAKFINIFNNSEISATNDSDLGLAGIVTLNARDTITISDSNVTTNGNDGLIYLGTTNLFDLAASNNNETNNIETASSINIINDSEISATNDSDLTLAGIVTLNARDTITISDSRVTTNGNDGLIFLGTSFYENISLTPPSTINIKGARTPNEDNSFNYTTNLTTTNLDRDNGLAGNIEIYARDSINIAGSRLDSTTEIATLSDNFDDDNFGTIRLEVWEENSAGQIILDQADINSTNSNIGFAGQITLNARDTITISDSRVTTNGNDGRIYLGTTNLFDLAQSNNNETNSVETAKFINIFNNSEISATNDSDLTLAGIVTLNARDTITISDSRVTTNGYFGLIFLGTSFYENISLTPPSTVNIDNNSSLSATNEDVLESTTPINSGDINIYANEDIFLSNSSTISTVTERLGDAGNVTLDAGNNITLRNENNREKGNQNYILSSTFGRGDAGKITLNAGNNITLKNENIIEDNENYIQSSTSGEGDAGNVTLTAGNNITLQNENTIGGNQNFIQSSIFGQGNAKTVTLTAKKGTISIDNSTIFNNVERGGVGDAGNITIEAQSLFLLNGSEIQTLVRGPIGEDINAGQRDAGNIALTANNGEIKFDNSRIFSTVEPGAEGDAGDITIEAQSLSLLNGSQIQSLVRQGNQENPNAGQGNAGNIEISVEEEVNITGESATNSPSLISSEVQEGDFNAGNITITISDGSFIMERQEGQDGRNQNQLNSSAAGTGQAGIIVIDASDTITIDGSDINTDGDFGFIFLGNLDTDNAALVSVANLIQPDNNIDPNNVDLADVVNLLQSADFNNVDLPSLANSLPIEATIPIEIENNSGISAESDSARSGSIVIVANSLNLKNGSSISSETEGGTAGNIIIGNNNTALEILTINDSAITVNGQQGTGGNINITANSLEQNGGRITAESDSGTSGNIEIVTNSLTLNNGSSISSQTTSRTAGSITIENENNTALETLTINNSEITVNGLEGTGGDINITANSLEQNGGSITANTGSGEGANINLNIRDLWVLSNESLVSANAQGEENSQGTDAVGGNIRINQDDSFDSELLIFAFPPTGIRGNDIAANGLEAEAGNINLKAAGVFGIEARDIAPEETEKNSLNDLTATSNIGSDGNVTLQTNIEDPSSGLVELPESVGDASDQITQNPCEEGVGSEFVVTGKGGLPANPQNNFSSDGVRVALVEPITEDSQSTTVSTNGIPSQEEAKEIVPAKGWIFNDRGQVVLTAYDPTQKGIQRSQETFTGCIVPQNQAQQHN